MITVMQAILATNLMIENSSSVKYHATVHSSSDRRYFTSSSDSEDRSLRQSLNNTQPPPGVTTCHWLTAIAQGNCLPPILAPDGQHKPRSTRNSPSSPSCLPPGTLVASQDGGHHKNPPLLRIVYSLALVLVILVRGSRTVNKRTTP